MVILRPLSFRSSESSGGRRQIMVILHTFSPSRGDRVRWHVETNYGHYAPFHPGPIVSDGTQRQIMVILRLVSTKRNEFGSIRMMLVVRCWSFSRFLQVFHSRRPETLKSSDARNSSLLGRDDRAQWRREVSWLSNFVVFKTLKFVDASDAFSFLSEWQVPLAGILTSRVMFHSNEISVLSLLRFYLR